VCEEMGGIHSKPRLILSLMRTRRIGTSGPTRQVSPCWEAGALVVAVTLEPPYRRTIAKKATTKTQTVKAHGVGVFTKKKQKNDPRHISKQRETSCAKVGSYLENKGPILIWSCSTTKNSGVGASVLSDSWSGTTGRSSGGPEQA